MLAPVLRKTKREEKETEDNKGASTNGMPCNLAPLLIPARDRTKVNKTARQADLPKDARPTISSKR